MSNLLDELNPRQREAVELTEGPLLILAGAGSGKTRVITYRIAHLLQSRGISPEGILAVTFTNKAADQMKERVAALLARAVERPSSQGLSASVDALYEAVGAASPSGLRPDRLPHISTFHSFCVRVLRRGIDKLGYNRDFSIYDEDDQQRLMKVAIEELGLGSQTLTPRATLSRISFWKNRGVSPEDAYQKAADPVTAKIAPLFDLYQRKLRQANALDFDDLLLKTVALLDEAKEVCDRYNARFRYILVDEYQDTNRIQYKLIRQLTRAHQNLCVVGDEDQSIYRWRGADIENILSFEEDYPSAKIIRLEQNYRSTQTILDAASAVVGNNRARKGKTLWTKRGQGQRLGLYEARDAEDEASFIAGQIAECLTSRPNDAMAVLYRTNAQSRVMEEALRLRNISYRLVGSFSFYARAEIKDALAYARLALNPGDSAAFLRIVNMPPRGIGEATLGALQDAARQGGSSLWETLDHELEGTRLSSRALAAFRPFHRLMRELMADRERLSLAEFFRNVLERTKYLQMLEAERSPEADSRIENLEELVNAAAIAEERGENLAEFLDHAALVSDTDQIDERARVTLMTLHSAKGLEFPTVFLVGLEEGIFPHKLSLDDAAALEEERRLCYVGMTRAKDQLILTWANFRRSYGREGYEGNRPSRFLSEVPNELIEPLGETRFGAKPRTTWDSAVNSVRGLERFFEERGRVVKVRHGKKELSFGESPSKTQAPGARWKIGTRVRHAKYGLGTIMNCEGEGDDAKLTVSFPGYGLKKLVERYASLERV